jgi:hypothetical protein
LIPLMMELEKFFEILGVFPELSLLFVKENFIDKVWFEFHVKQMLCYIDRGQNGISLASFVVEPIIINWVDVYYAILKMRHADRLTSLIVWRVLISGTQCINMVRILLIHFMY